MNERVSFIYVYIYICCYVYVIVMVKKEWTYWEGKELTITLFFKKKINEFKWQKEYGRIINKQKEKDN